MMHVRIVKEFNDILEKYIIIPINESIYNFFVILKGNKDTPYENIPFVFKFEITEQYPFDPPNVTYIGFTKQKIHPNLYLNGRVCLSLLGTYIGPNSVEINKKGWTPIQNLTSIIMSIQSLLDEQPLFYEPCAKHTKQNIENYNNKIKVEIEECLPNYLQNIQIKNKDLKEKLKTILSKK